VKSDLAAEAYEVDVRVREQRTVAPAMIKFRGVLYELDLSPHREETFAVKVEIDTNPPAGGVLTTRLVRKHYLLNLMQYDKSSLLAGKLHAVLTRKYTKGRDLYDLMWYLASPDWPSPNVNLLNHALSQTGWNREPLTERSWRQVLAAWLKNVDWKQARDDVAPFLERQQDLALIEPATFERLLGRKVLSLDIAITHAISGLGIWGAQLCFHVSLFSSFCKELFRAGPAFFTRI
jgi:hypothetical protein